MSGFSTVDLSQLPAPTLIETLDYETILQEQKTELIALDPSMADVLKLESEPALKILQTTALREFRVRQRVNEAAKATMLAFALKSDLDQRGANMSVKRLLISAGDPDAVPPVDPVYEEDEDYRRRIQLAWEGYTTAGSKGSYTFHALSAHADVQDASATRPVAGDVLVAVLSRTGDGTAPQPLLNTVETALSAETIRPLNDTVIVQSANIINYSVNATLYFLTGAGRTVAMQQAQASLAKYKAAQHRLGLDITLSGIYGALHQPGVQRVELTSPAADITVDQQSAAYCTGTNLIDGGIDE